LHKNTYLVIFVYRRFVTSPSGATGGKKRSFDNSLLLRALSGVPCHSELGHPETGSAFEPTHFIRFWFVVFCGLPLSSSWFPLWSSGRAPGFHGFPPFTVIPLLETCSWLRPGVFFKPQISMLDWSLELAGSDKGTVTEMRPGTLQVSEPQHLIIKHPGCLFLMREFWQHLVCSSPENRQ